MYIRSDIWLLVKYSDDLEYAFWTTQIEEATGDYTRLTEIGLVDQHYGFNSGEMICSLMQPARFELVELRALTQVH